MVTVHNESRPLSERAGSTPRGYDQAGAYGVTAAARDTVRALEHAYGLREVSAWPIATLHVHCIVFRVPHTTARERLLDQLVRDPRVESAQALNEFTAQSMRAEPEDTQPARESAPDSSADSAQQRAQPASPQTRPERSRVRPTWMPYNDPYAPLQRALRELDVIDAQRQSRGAGVRIAVIDTGLDFNHPDLAGRVVTRRNFVDADERQFVQDRHGTEVAGVIAAVANNGIGIVGVAPDAQLLAYKACWQPAEAATRAVCNSFTLAQALEAAILARADIVNLSLAGPRDPLLARLVRDGERQGMLFVGAVPPSGDEGFPTAVPGVLAVESAEDGPWRAGHLLAPGRDVLTLTPGGHYDFASGSSLASAEITGILALMIAERGHLSAAEAEQVLAGSGQAIAVRGMPLVNACRALVETLRQTRVKAAGWASCGTAPESRAPRSAESFHPRS